MVLRSKYALPTMTFPYKITTRLAIMAIPRRQVEDKGDGMPVLSSTGVRISALKGHTNERLNECAWPYVRRLITLRQMYKDKFSRQRLERIERMITAANGTIYSKLSNSVVIVKKTAAGEDIYKGSKKKKSWNESDWRKHMEYISQIANPKPVFLPEPVKRGPRVPLEQMRARIELLSQIPQSKVYKRLSQDEWYRDPTKVRPKALKYVISDRVKKLAEPKAPRPEN